MASDNNINSLANDAADVDTSELEILSVDLIPTDEELEMDADTFSLEEHGPDVQTVSSLQSDLRSRDERISTLQYDIEQLRSRWSGLEKEIEAREELTALLQADLKAAHKKLSEKDRDLGKLQREIEDLSKRLEGSETAAATAAEEAETLAKKIDAEKASGEDSVDALQTELDKSLAEAAEQRERADAISLELETLRERIASDQPPEQRYLDARQEVAELRDYIDGRQADWTRQEEEIERLTNELSERRDKLVKRERELSRLEANLGSIDSERGRLEAMLKIARSENSDLRSRHSSARKQIIDYSTGERSDFEQTIAEQHGTIVEQKHRIQELEDASTRSQEYADSLRLKLKSTEDHWSTSEDALQGRHEALDEAQQTIADLEKQLQETSTLASDVTTELGEIRERFDEETSALQTELDDANASLETHSELNERLGAELSEATLARDLLAERVGELEREIEHGAQPLQSRINALEASLEEANSTIANKDNAISALLNELANKSRSMESIGEIESVIHELDGRMSERIDESSPDERDRHTRLLTGTVDGQDLRFPLFKDRLTIGRTANNDIQLRAQYVSRRHAVVFHEKGVTKIVDWQSKNGVYVNKARISEQVLENGDLITIGTAEFLYEERSRRDSD